MMTNERKDEATSDGGICALCGARGVADGSRKDTRTEFPARALVAFLHDEIARARSLLGDTADSLSREIASLAAASSSGTTPVARLIELMQGEDLIQQRLHDASLALGALDQMLDVAAPENDASVADWPANLISRLRLGDTRSRLDRHLVGDDPSGVESGHTTSTGHVDLF